MNSRSFDEKRIAEGYAKDRPYLHGQVMELLKEDLQIGEKFAYGLDVGCGAGLSTRALKSLCDRVAGIDISGEMVAAAKALYGNQNAAFYQSSAEEIKGWDHVFDIVTAAGVVNWVNEKKFLSSLRSVMKDRGILLVYDFWITDQMEGNSAYTNWWHDCYLKEFPRPLRKEYIWTQEMTYPYGFEIKKQKNFYLSCEFDREAFIRFMMLQSNVNVQVSEKGRSVDEIRQWFDRTLKESFAEEKKILVFEGYYWCLELRKQ